MFLGSAGAVNPGGAFTAAARPASLLTLFGDLIAIIAATAVVGLLNPWLMPSPTAYAPLAVMLWLAPGMLVLGWMASRGRAGRRSPGRMLLAGGLAGAVGTAAVGGLLLPDLHRAVGPAMAWILFPAPALGMRALLGQPAALLLLRDRRRAAGDALARLRDRVFGYESRWAMAVPSGGVPRQPGIVPPGFLARGVADPEMAVGLAASSRAPVLQAGPALPGRSGAALACKSAFDVAVAGGALLFLAPLMLVLAGLVKLDGGPVLFAHGRIGRGGARFPCLKFRSMVIDSDAVLHALLQTDPAAAAEWAETQKLRHDPRITLVGRFMRKTSLDELPQLFNVLRRDMSLVGPRPIVDAEVVRYGDDIAYYLAARPGITGLWQVSGRSDTSYAERVALDTAYVRDWSLWKDARIVVRTIPAVLNRKGAV